jgi:predicted nucleic acid-binding protein
LILYLDTSAFIKLYVEEAGSASVRAAASRSSICSHWITYAEMRAALARLHRMGYQSDAAYRAHRVEFERDWKAVNAILPHERMLRRAGDLAERFGLRGYDSVHLAAAESLLAVPGAEFLRFASFDRALNEAAGAIGLHRLLA